MLFLMKSFSGINSFTFPEFFLRVPSPTFCAKRRVCFLREAKKDPVARQAYRLLTTIHDSFEQISEKILARDRIQRDVAERDRKLAAMTSRSLNTNKLQSDLDAIVRENSYLEQQLQDKSNP